MQLEHQFTVPAPVDVVWQALLDPELVAPCMPGASLSKVEGDEFTGSVKVKLGPVNLTYKGSGQFVERDEQQRRAVLKASGKDVRGNSTASATITVGLRPDGSGTTATVTSDLNITGRPAQMGRGMMNEVGGKILNTFATNLAARLAPEPVAAETAAGQAAAKPAEQAKPAEAKPAETAAAGGEKTESTAEPGDAAQAKPQQPAAEPEALDLLGTAAGPVLKRVLPVVGAIVVAVIVYLIVRNRG